MLSKLSRKLARFWFRSQVTKFPRYSHSIQCMIGTPNNKISFRKPPILLLIMFYRVTMEHYSRMVKPVLERLSQLVVCQMTQDSKVSCQDHLRPYSNKLNVMDRRNTLCVHLILKSIMKRLRISFSKMVRRSLSLRTRIQVCMLKTSPLLWLRHQPILWTCSTRVILIDMLELLI
jgi:thymidylate kinase